MNQDRHSGIYSIPYFMKVILVGAGGIGAMAAVTLAKMGVNFLEIWDGDRVDPINLATQLHPVSGVGKAKVNSVAAVAYEFSDDVRVSAQFANVDDTVVFDPSEIIVSAVDSINARKTIWQAVLRSQCRWYLDTRMSAEVFQMSVVNMGSYKARTHYDAAITSVREEDVPDVVCTEKATFFTACAASGHIGAAVKRIVTGNDRSYQVVHYIAQNRLLELGL